MCDRETKQGYKKPREKDRTYTLSERRYYNKKEVKRATRKAECDFVNIIIEEGLKNNDTKPFWRYIKSRKHDNIGVSPLKDKSALHTS